MKRLACLFVVLALLVGCDEEKQKKLQQRLAKAQAAADTTAAAIKSADPIVGALEDASGYEGLPADKVVKVTSGLEKTQQVIEKMDKVLDIVGAIPGPQQPYTTGAAGVLGIIGTISAAVAGFLKNRKTRKEKDEADAALASVQQAVDHIDGIGKIINAQAANDGTLPKVAEVYQNHLVS